LALDANLGKEISQAKLIADPSFVLKELLIRVKELEVLHSCDKLPPLCNMVFAKALRLLNFQRPLKIPSFPLNRWQSKAIEKVCNLPVSFIWGPPGTGKTRTLAFAVKALESMGEKVLIMAHSNVAVDTAALKIAEAFENSPTLKEGLILRYGTPFLPSVRHHPYLTAEGILERLYPDKIDRLRKLEEELTKKAKTMRFQDIERELKRLREWKKTGEQKPSNES
jgi:Cdc6-like AAA superfamily ATPase